MSVLVDSSVWIAAASALNAECRKLKRMIVAGEPIVVTRIIQMEVTQGARSEVEWQRLWDSLDGFPILELTDRHWALASSNYFRCRKRGITPSSVDCLIATLAADHRVPLWTLDRGFISASMIAASSGTCRIPRPARLLKRRAARRQPSVKSRVHPRL